MFDTITSWILFGTWIVYLAWELFLLSRRVRYEKRKVGEYPRLISGLARDRAWRALSIVYTWCAMASHWWWNGPTLFPEWTGYVFWGIIVGLLAWDIQNWKNPMEKWPTWMRYARWPLLWAALGLLAGRLLFPQGGITPWDFRPLN